MFVGTQLGMPDGTNVGIAEGLWLGTAVGKLLEGTEDEGNDDDGILLEGTEEEGTDDDGILLEGTDDDGTVVGGNCEQTTRWCAMNNRDKRRRDDNTLKE